MIKWIEELNLTKGLPKFVLCINWPQLDFDRPEWFNIYTFRTPLNNTRLTSHNIYLCYWNCWNTRNRQHCFCILNKNNFQEQTLEEYRKWMFNNFLHCTKWNNFQENMVMLWANVMCKYVVQICTLVSRWLWHTPINSRSVYMGIVWLVALI